MAENLWATETPEDARAYDARKDSGRFRFSVAVKRAVLWRLIEPRLPSPDRETPILDLGGGTGVWAIRLAEAGHRVTMLDIAPGYLARAREKIAAAGLTDLIAVEQGDICDLSRYAADAYPVVLALATRCRTATTQRAPLARFCASRGPAAFSSPTWRTDTRRCVTADAPNRGKMLARC